MRTIIQFGPLELDPDVDKREERTFRVPRGTQVLCVQNRFGGAWIYCLCDQPPDSASEKVDLTILIVGPNYRAPFAGIDDGYRHVDSLQFRNGEALLHFFAKVG
jgi:hypothetical protein